MFPTGIAFMASLIGRGVAAAKTDAPPDIAAGRPAPPYVAALPPVPPVMAE